MQFQFLSPHKVLFGCGQRHELEKNAATLGQNALVVSGSRTLKNSAIWSEMSENLASAGVEIAHEVECLREPAIADVDSAVRETSDSTSPIDLVIGIGGGAALDLAKAISAMLTNRHGGSVRDFLEGVGTGQTLQHAPVPMIAVPTTAGTGSEATKNAVISVPNPACKKSLRSEQMIPDIVVIDPELALTVPPQVTAAAGMDAITQLIESYISIRSHPLTQALCLEGLKHAIPNIERAYNDGSNIEARTAMAYAAYLSGVALANSGLGMAHGVAAALGAICDVPHGLACATLLPIAMKTNQSTSRKEQAVLGKLFAKNPHLSKADAIAASIDHIEKICDALSIPRRLSELGVSESDLPAIVAGSRGNSMNGNPRQLTDSELTQILEENL